LQTAGQHGFGLVDIRLTFEYEIIPVRNPAHSDPSGGRRRRGRFAGDCPDGTHDDAFFQ
jgi:hypothetical protein